MSLKDHLIAAALALAVAAASMTIGGAPEPSADEGEHPARQVSTSLR